MSPVFVYYNPNPVVDRLYDMMRTGPDERTRMAYQKAIDEMEGRRY